MAKRASSKSTMMQNSLFYQILKNVKQINRKRLYNYYSYTRRIRRIFAGKHREGVNTSSLWGKQPGEEIDARLGDKILGLVNLRVYVGPSRNLGSH